ncbi:MAG: hypothetical protein K2M48_02885 [Clostridiales bacterium]|nr:hypothetical protein [Clostridiales bacterium]
MRKQEQKTCGADLLRECLHEFIKNVDMSYMAIETESGVLTVSREVQARTKTHAIGFDCGNADKADDE